MWKERSGAYIKINNEKYELIANAFSEADYIQNLSIGQSFYLDSSIINGYLTTFSIEDAVKIRDYLNDMIEVAAKSGYFDREEMTLEEIEVALGHKIKLVDKKEN